MGGNRFRKNFYTERVSLIKTWTGPSHFFLWGGRKRGKKVPRTKDFLLHPWPRENGKDQRIGFPFFFHGEGDFSFQIYFSKKKSSLPRREAEFSPLFFHGREGPRHSRWNSLLLTGERGETKDTPKKGALSLFLERWDLTLKGVQRIFRDMGKKERKLEGLRSFAKGEA